MWSLRSKRLANNRITWIAIEAESTLVSYLDVLRLWSDNPEFREFYLSVMSGTPYPAFRWETPPLTKTNANRPFEFVMLDSPGLVARPDLTAFAAHFGAEKPGSIVEFPNLGGDAILVVPSPHNKDDDYSHLAAFNRNAPKSVQHRLWAKVGVAMQRRLSKQPVWLSTAGGGVAWLHIRLDNRPKYYGYEPYRQYTG